jgi:hypothetical protein
MSDPWAAPDWQPEPGLAPAAPRPDVLALRGRRAGDARPELPVPLRRLTMADRLDGALRILKLAPGTVLALTAAAVAPFEVLAAGALHGEDDPFVRTFLGAALTALVTDDTGAGAAVPLLFLFLDTVVVAFVAAGMAMLVGAWHRGERPGTAVVLRTTAARLPALVIAMAITHAAQVVGGLVLAVGALVPLALWAVVAPVIGAESTGPLVALRRSYRLTKGSWGLVLSTCFLVAFACVILRLSLGAAAALYASTGWPGDWAVATAVSVAARLVTVPLVAGSAVLVYLDLRVRHEGLDIDLAVTERLPGAG